MDRIEAIHLRRRAFLRYLAGSPLLAAFGIAGCSSERAGAGPGAEAGPQWEADLGDPLGQLIAAPADALNVFDFHAVARQRLPPAHYGYLATGVESDSTLRANREAFSRFYLRPRRLVDVSRVDTATRLFGAEWKTPIVLAPAGSQRAFHPDGEIGTARAARSRAHLQILSTVSTCSVEEVAEARGAPIWYQLYPTRQWEATCTMLRRAEKAGCPLVVLTVDLPVDSQRETLERYKARDTRDCTQCHSGSWHARKPMLDGFTVPREVFAASGLTWDFIRRLKQETSMRLAVKGILTGEDAARCVEYGADGIIVSNHGGRATENGRGAIESLSEVVDAVQRRVPVLVDSGFRRGNDILKALALGADAVCIGRPYLWGLAAFGQAGVEAVLDLLTRELQLAMALAGVPTLRDIDRTLVGPRG